MTRLLGFGAALLLATSGAIAAQHPGTKHDAAPHSKATHATSTHQFPHQLCESHEQRAGGHHAEIATALGLTAEQAASVDRIAAEACAAMAKYHEQIHAVLTPEQRAKLQELHGTAGHADKKHQAPAKHGGK